MDTTKMSFVLAITGIIALFFATENLAPVQASVSEITTGYAGRDVVVNGTIKSLSIKEGNIFITLEEKDFRIVIFRNKADDSNYALKKGDRISAAGKVQIYKNELEVIAENVSKY